MARFRIYYDDGTTHTDGEPAEGLKKYGVICILQRVGDSARYHMVSGTPYYMLVSDEWVPSWENDLADYLIHTPEKIQATIMGRITSKRQFTEVYEQAKKDRENECLHN